MDARADGEIERHLAELDEDRAVASLAERYRGPTTFYTSRDVVQTRVQGLLFDVANV